MNNEVVSSGGDYTSRSRSDKPVIVIEIGSTYNGGIVDLSHFVTVLGGQRELNSSEEVVGDSEVVEPHISDPLCNRSISSILPGGEAVEVCGDRRVLPPRIGLALGSVFSIISDASARELSRNHVVEDSESVPTARVSVIVSKLTDLVIFWADISVGVWSDGVDLQIVPIGVPVRATNPILDEGVIGLSDPEACWSLICVESRPRSFNLDQTVPLQPVLLFDGILDENIVALD